MKKLLLSLFAAMLAVGVNAQKEVVFDFDNNATALFGIEGRSSGTGATAVNDGDILETVTATVDGVSITVTPKAETANTENRLWTSSPVLRLYSGTLTVSAPGHKISSIAITQGKWNDYNTFDSGTFANNVWTAGSDVASVTLTVAANTQLKKMVVTLDGEAGGNDTPSEPVVPEVQNVTVAEALAVIAGLADGASTEGYYTVSGKVQSITEISSQYGNATFVLEGGLTVFRVKYADGVNFTSEDQLKVGDEVVVYGQLQKYVKEETVTPELKSGYLLSINGVATKDNGGTTPDTPTAPVVPEVQNVTVAEALAVIAGLADGASTEGYYTVSGKVQSITEISSQYGNATFVLEGGLTVFRVKYADGVNFASEDQLKVGDEVVVYGQLQKYVKEETVTPELKSGYLLSINGVATKDNGGTTPDTPGDYQLVGDGSQANPYTVADVQHLGIETSDGNCYWVKGYILGSAASATKLNAADKAADTNVALGATADAETFIPVALPAPKEGEVNLRALLGVATNPQNIGKEVLVYGTLEKYFSVAGVKNVVAAVIDGASTGIASVAPTTRSAAIYDLQGRRVQQAVRGLYIVNGKKVVK